MPTGREFLVQRNPLQRRRNDRLWTGSKPVRLLRHATTEIGEGFNARGVTADGGTMIYEHFGKNSLDPDYRRQGRLYMRLPRR